MIDATHEMQKKGMKIRTLTCSFGITGDGQKENTRQLGQNQTTTITGRTVREVEAKAGDFMADLVRSTAGLGQRVAALEQGGQRGYGGQSAREESGEVVVNQGPGEPVIVINRREGTIEGVNL